MSRGKRAHPQGGATTAEAVRNGANAAEEVRVASAGGGKRSGRDIGAGGRKERRYFDVCAHTVPRPWAWGP